MGKEIRAKPEAAALSADPERSIGAYLARQRELRGISVEELAALTRIPRRSLERLESGVFDRAPDGFVRGFVRTVAAALGLDPDETVMRLLSEPAAEAADARGQSAGWTSPGARIVLLAIGVLLAAGALGWLATSFVSRPAVPRADGVVVRPDPIRELAREATARPPAAPEPAGTAAADSAASPTEPAAAPAESPAAVAESPATAEHPSAAARAEAQAATEAPGAGAAPAAAAAPSAEPSRVPEAPGEPGAPHRGAAPEAGVPPVPKPSPPALGETPAPGAPPAAPDPPAVP